MIEWVAGFEEMYIVIYCVLILWVNVDYLREAAHLREGLTEIGSEDELLFNPHHFSIVLMGLAFNFFRRWLVYVLAVVLTENVVVLVVSLILFIASLYDTLFNYTLAKMKKSKIGLYVVMADVVFIGVFVVYVMLK
ncbi:hypothetical protein [Jeotgalibacillus sp. R-1-5s-1]|uniref:hypothetical protein n=1 Tax=Jeotgalibacillus sp. R-1-5s-1 TaxID=2555897 RepID=UPI00106B9CB5|nr:hypothetical protein [Jeotgalibacillus sp. R-1-5s-1]TFD94383.1 hypothetical protein E2491_13145 [Jeotgalibacillus sp. R-1-5s-1]